MENPKPQSEEQIKKQQEFFEKARKGVLKFLDEKGGKLKMGELHEYSLSKYFIQHQRFSKLMESFTDGGLIDYDWETQEATITEAGKKFVAS